MTEQYGLTPEDYLNDVKLMPSERYVECMPIVLQSFSKQRLKPFQGITANLMLYDLIYQIPQQMRVSTSEQ